MGLVTSTGQKSKKEGKEDSEGTVEEDRRLLVDKPFSANAL